jgi:hypothetical protein
LSRPVDESNVTWDDLFERAAPYGVAEADVRAALSAVRDDGTEDGDRADGE